MRSIITIILGVIFVGIVVLLCLFSCIIASHSDKYWDEVKKDMEKRNERR